SLLLDPVTEGPLEDFVIPDYFLDHACNKSSCINNYGPETSVYFEPIPEVLPNHFTPQQKTLLIESLDAKKNPQQFGNIIKRLKESVDTISAEFNVSELLLLTNVLQENPQQLSLHL